MNGVNLMPPLHPVESNCTLGMESIGAGWISLVTYIAGYMDKPLLNYDQMPRRWGDTPEGVEAMVVQAREKGFKIMLKPSIWIPGFGWPGEMSFKSNKDWEEWENNYRNYLFEYLEIAKKHEVEIFCIGTEIKQAVKERPDFWNNLIQEIRSSYPGKLTYSSNWDNFYEVDFWDQLDFIGVDAYFPLVEARTPGMKELKRAWRTPKKQLEVFSTTWQKPILLTEFGYRSIDRCAWQQWEFEHLRNGEAEQNTDAQVNAYQAILEECWNQEWCAGGFIWNWEFEFEAAPSNDNGYSPNNKPAASTISKFYTR